MMMDKDGNLKPGVKGWLTIISAISAPVLTLIAFEVNRERHAAVVDERLEDTRRDQRLMQRTLEGMRDSLGEIRGALGLPPHQQPRRRASDEEGANLKEGQGAARLAGDCQSGGSFRGVGRRGQPGDCAFWARNKNQIASSSSWWAPGTFGLAPSGSAAHPG